MDQTVWRSKQTWKVSPPNIQWHWPELVLVVLKTLHRLTGEQTTQKEHLVHWARRISQSAHRTDPCICTASVRHPSKTPRLLPIYPSQAFQRTIYTISIFSYNRKIDKLPLKWKIRIAIIFCLQIPRAISDDMKMKAVFFWSWFLFSSPLLRGRGGRLVGPHFIAADAQRVGDRDTDETLAGGGLRESHAALRLVAAVARLQRTTNKPISCSGKPWLGCLQTRDTQGRMEAGALAALAKPRGQACVSYDSHPSTNTTLRLPKVETSGRLIQETTQEVFGADGIDPVSFSSCATVHSMRRACYDPAVWLTCRLHVQLLLEPEVILYFRLFLYKCVTVPQHTLV